MVIGTYTKFMPRELAQSPVLEGMQKPDALVEPQSLAGGGSVGGTKGASFSNLLENAVSEVNGKMEAAQVEQNKMITGESTNVHQAMIAVQEASVAFSLMVEVRNKLVESYQEMMRMQV